MRAFSEDLVLYREIVPGGWNWSHVLKRGTALRLRDLNGGACGALLAYNPVETSERYNMPDTFKAQFTSILTGGHALYSDMGRILLSILSDSYGGHDSFGGVMAQNELEARFGVKRYQQARNSYFRSGALSLLSELSKYGLCERDLVPNVNFFTRLVTKDSGELSFGPSSAPGATVDLQAEMTTLVVLAATQHPLDPRPVWEPRPIEITLWNSAVPPEENPAQHLNEQNQRGFFNTQLYSL